MSIEHELKLLREGNIFTKVFIKDKPPSDFYELSESLLRAFQQKFHNEKYIYPITKLDKLEIFKNKGKSSLHFDFVNFNKEFEKLDEGKQSSIWSEVENSIISVLSSKGFEITEHDKHISIGFKYKKNPAITGTVHLEDFPNTLYLKYKKGS